MLVCGLCLSAKKIQNSSNWCCDASFGAERLSVAAAASLSFNGQDQFEAEAEAEAAKFRSPRYERTQSGEKGGRCCGGARTRDKMDNRIIPHNQPPA